MKTFFLFAALTLTLDQYSKAQILCILCYDQNDSLSDGVNNLLTNGGFESGCLTYGYYCPSSASYSCNLTGWTCTGGGPATYAQIFDGSSSEIVQGGKAAYFGNYYCNACSINGDDTSCINVLDCTVGDLPNGYPVNSGSYGGTTGISLKQEATGLTVGDTYILEFWAGGEDFGAFYNKGLFALDVGFGDTLLRCKATNPGDIGTTYIVEFNATSTSQTIKFTNWGHVCSTCTELVLDNVRLYTLAELSPLVTVCLLSSNASFVASDTSLCQKFCINFFDSSTNNPTSWLWEFPGAAPSFSTDQNPTNICYDAPGSYDVTLITTNSIGSDSTTLLNYITVYPTPPIPTITQNGYTLTSSPAGFYQWQLNAVDIPGATNQSYDVLQTGLYTVLISDTNSCKNSAALYVQITGIDAVSDAIVSIYPNPSNGNFIIKLMNAPSSDEISLSIVNALGQKIYSSLEKISSSKWKKEIDLTTEAAGIYFIEIKSNNFFARKKITISK